MPGAKRRSWDRVRVVVRIAILSDVHGNLAALEAVSADIEAQRPELVLHGGDLAFGGPRPAECVDLVRERGWAGIRGNTDDGIGGGRVALVRRIFFAPVARWARERLGPERVRWLMELPLEVRAQGVFLVH